VGELTTSQLRTRERVESLIALAAPALDFVLLMGDRLSRVVEPEDHEYYPARPLAEPNEGISARPVDGHTGQ
jgi:hypothetical protein